MNPIYLDYNATTPIDPAAFEAMRPYLWDAAGIAQQRFGNSCWPRPNGNRGGILVRKERET